MSPLTNEIAALRAQLTTAERERDEARRERDSFEQMAKAWKDHADSVVAELVTLRHRAERAERVVAAARAYEKNRHTHWQRALWDAARALDAAEGKPHA